MTGEEIVRKLLDSRTRLIENGKYGPYRAVIPASLAGRLKERYYPAAVFLNEDTIRDRILQIVGIKGIVIEDYVTEPTVESL